MVKSGAGATPSSQSSLNAVPGNAEDSRRTRSDAGGAPAPVKVISTGVATEVIVLAVQTPLGPSVTPTGPTDGRNCLLSANAGSRMLTVERRRISKPAGSVAVPPVGTPFTTLFPTVTS